MEEEIERFECERVDGTRCTVVGYQEYTRFRPLSGPASWVKAMKRLELADGSSFVNFIDGERYKIVVTDEVVRRV